MGKIWNSQYRERPKHGVLLRGGGQKSRYLLTSTDHSAIPGSAQINHLPGHYTSHSYTQNIIFNLFKQLIHIFDELAFKLEGLGKVIRKVCGFWARS